MANEEAQKAEQIAVFHTQEQLLQGLTDLGIYTSVPLTTFSVRWLYEDEQRLDASYYAKEVFAARRIIRDCGFESPPLEELTDDLFYPGRFKRVYAKTEADGVPFLTASEMLSFRPTSDMFLANSSAYLESCRVKPHWILITRSGTVGRCVLVGRRLSHFAISDDAIRVNVRDVPAGYLYAMLSSWISQTLLTKDQYGSAIKHLEPHHIAALPVPLLPEPEQQTIHDEIMHAYSLRDEANDLLDEADSLLHQELGLPRFDESLVSYLSPPQRKSKSNYEMPHPRAFSIKASDFNERFDASHHIPLARTAISLLHQGKYTPVRLEQIAEKIYIPPRFKRIYVPKEHGVPFLRPSQLTQMYPYGLGYISKLTKELEYLLLRSGDVLVTTDGTIGRISLVTTHITDWSGSNNIARITYGNADSRNGYLVAFLTSAYGYYQLVREIYGGVIDHLEVPHLANIWIPDAPKDVQKGIGRLVVSAFEKKDQATSVEAAAIEHLNEVIEKDTKR